MKSMQHPRVDPGAEYGQSAYQQGYKKRKMSRSAAEDEFAPFAGDADMAGIDDNLGGLI
jgi:regulator of Ty1 transposition protein 103